ncbi:unnamed protein product [Schistocephalus solidus]|uniref:LisH domain-containing protein n=1 Tax=Schistocephalus solidus TaxID=70667 RepID=A0A3P7CX71_SCHSO|nr:unnamed protein product [Schistocephalus solidus]
MMGAQMFFSLLPSEISRLVLGYLAENGCYEACNVFFLECAHLTEIRGQFPSAYDITCRVGGISLMDILHDYIRTVNLINEELEARSPTWTSSPSAACRPGQTSTCLRTFISRYCSRHDGTSVASPSSSSSCPSSSVPALMTASQRSQPAPFSGISFHPACRPQQSRIAMARHNSIQSYPPVPSAAGYSTAATSSAAAIFVPLHPIVTGNTRPLRARFQMATIQTIQNRCSLPSFSTTTTTTCPSVPLLRPICPPASTVLGPTPSSVCTAVISASDPSLENLSSHKRKRISPLRQTSRRASCSHTSQLRSSFLHFFTFFQSPIPTPRAPMQPMTLGLPNKRVGIDLIGPLPILVRGFEYTLLMVDVFTKCVVTVPLLRQDATSAANAIDALNASQLLSQSTATLLAVFSLLLSTRLQPNPEFEGLVEQLLKEMEQNTVTPDGHSDQPFHSKDNDRSPPAVPLSVSPSVADLATSVNSAEGHLTGFLCPLSPDPVTGITKGLTVPIVSTDEEAEEEEREKAPTKMGSKLLQEVQKVMDSSSSPLPSAAPLTVQTSSTRAATSPLEPRLRSPHFYTSIEQHLSTALSVSSKISSSPTATISAPRAVHFSLPTRPAEAKQSGISTIVAGDIYLVHHGVVGTGTVTCAASTTLSRPLPPPLLRARYYARVKETGDGIVRADLFLSFCPGILQPIVSSRVKLLTPPGCPTDVKPLTPKVTQRPTVSASFAPPPAANLFPCSPPPAANLFPCSPQTPATEIHPCFTQFKPDPDLTNLGFSGSTPFGGFGASCPLNGEDNDLSWFFDDVSASIRATEAAHPRTESSSSFLQPEPSRCSSEISTPTTSTTTTTSITSTSIATLPQLVASSASAVVSTLLSSPQTEQQCQTSGLFDHSTLLVPTSCPQTLPPPLPIAHSTVTTTTTSSSTLLVSSNSWLRVVDLSALEVQPICLPSVTTPQPIAPNPSPRFRRPPLRCAANVAMSVLGAPPVLFKPTPLGENTTVLGQTETHAATRSYPNLIVEPKKAPKYTSSRFLRAVEGGISKRPSEEDRPCRPSPDSTSTCSPGSEKPTPAKVTFTTETIIFSSILPTDRLIVVLILS